MIDLHSDTIYRLAGSKEPYTLLDNPFSITKSHLEKGHVGAQCFALFVHMGEISHSPWEELNLLHDRFTEEMDKAGIPQLRDISEYAGSVKAILTTEEGASIEGDIERLEELKRWGVMAFGLTWNFENELGYPNSKDKAVMSSGLKRKGFEAIEACEALGIAVDVSHLSDGGFWDVVEASHKPFIATHSNARAVTDVSRNLSDEMIKALADKGGVMGLNLCPAFLSDLDPGLPSSDFADSRVSDMVRHIEHIYRVGGEDVLAIGSDFDGIEGRLEIAHPDSFHLLFDALKADGMSERLIEKLRFRNTLRVFSDIQ